MLDISSSCRTCMKENVNLVDLYETVKIEENCHQLADILVICTPTQVSKEDGLPQKLCDECARVLQLIYTFRVQAEKAQEEFQKLLQNEIKTEPPEVMPKTENEDDYLNAFDDTDINHDFQKSEGIEENKFTCNKCSKTFLKEKKFIKHLQMHESPLLCTVCNKSYQNQVSLDKHLAKHNKEYSCSVCNLNFQTESKLLQHNMTEHTNNKIKIEVENEAQVTLLQCPDCDLTFTKQRSLSMHKRRHKNQKNEFICDTCGKAFSMKHQLKRHVVLHSDVKPHMCTKCSKSYARKDQLVHHMHTHKDSKPYECSYCKKGFTQLCSLKDHIRSHTGETPYLCSECGKGFTNSSNLRQHMMRHTGLKPYACNMCPKTFCTKGQMTSHMSTHTGEHPYKCEECGAAFTKQNSLKKHSLIHSGIRPFACDTCNMRFTCKDHLKRHYRIHTGEKPYRCNYCERAFSQSNDLVKHTRAHIGQNIYQCTICGMRFRLMSELKSHYPIHFVDGKMQPPEPKEDVIPPIRPSSPTKDLAPLLILKPPELPLLSFNTNKDMPLLLKPAVEKDMPILTMKPSSPNYNGLGTRTEVRTEDKNRYTITINSCDKNGLVNGITINIPTKDT
ncbi:unnamed protein product [Arctia plantaginis]|uniref:Uncharacterized protein n=1 Tax=Arctia plantaginis TaxID=874455 RepID=A0A8S0Z5L1_ARCPL|nr:unnamed protein product [Arctia plantaginis]